ncbi:MAG: MFS transporter [Rhodococcus sp. (in: high G+C Gram-positive bacteria)]|uniref:MFS transporter n=1 Tax=Rhodococcus sp. TaxID=1831 RepID=UPI003BB6F637
MSVITSEATSGSEFRTNWRVLLASVLGIATGFIAIPFYTNALFFPSLHTSFGWSVSSLSLVVLVYNIAFAACLPFAGRLVDRLGSRIPAAISGLCMATGYLVISQLGESYCQYLWI